VVVNFILAAFGNKYVRYAGAFVLLAIVLAGVRLHFIHQGEQRGREAATSDAAAQVEQERKAAKDSAVAEISTQQRRADEATRAYELASQREATLERTVASLSGRRQQGKDQVAGMKASNLHGYIVDRIGARAEADATPGYTADEERAIAKVVTDYPLLLQQIETQAQQMAQVREQVKALSTKVDAVETKYQALNAYTNEVERDYVTLHNLTAKPRPWFLRLFGLKPKKLPVPDPDELKGKRPLPGASS
jgi:hypothetical protein